MNINPPKSPQDIKALSLEMLRELAEDIRQMIISTCLKNGGHLGASLGVVELAIALHRVFDSPREPIVWDVGHQAYAHKLLTGRWERFPSLRTHGGISGFLSREESEHDLFGAGHSSTALSAALAMAWARGRQIERGEKDQTGDWTVAVVGDGGLTAGLAMEALNNVSGSRLGPLLMILNDNQMSISQNIGAISSVLATGMAPDFFGRFGFDYVGPVSGHDLDLLIGTLTGIKNGYVGKPVLLHVLTEKGKGYPPAEQRPAMYHGIGPVQASTGKKERAYSDAFGQEVCRIAEGDAQVVAITAAMPEGTGLTEFSRRFTDRFFDVGIAEPHAVTFAAGLATQGYCPVVAIYSTFLQRGLDGIIHDVALQNLKVIFALDRAGIVGPDGPTHHGAFDLAYLGMIPNLKVAAPACLHDVGTLLDEAVRQQGPYAIRYPRGKGPESFDAPLTDGIRWHARDENPELIVVALGASADRVLKAVGKPDSKVSKVTAISTVYAKPISKSLLSYLDQHSSASLMIVEDGVIRGGFGQNLIGSLKKRTGPVDLAGYADRFIPHGSVPELEEDEGLSVDRLLDRMQALLKRG